MNRLITICTIIFVLAVGSAQADLANGSFETGDLTGWSTTPTTPGDRVTVNTSHTDPGYATGITSWTPTDGTYFALLKTDGPGNFTQLYQSFTAPVGYDLTFDYFWDSWEWWDPPKNDMGRGRLLSGVGLLGETVTTFFTHTVNTDPEGAWGTPWTSISYTILSPGTYTLLFEVANAGDSSVDSYLGVDNVHVVPVPAAVILGILGLGAVGLKLRKFA